MDDAALIFVREDTTAAERLAAALERAGVIICRSASVFEDPTKYGAIVALFSPAAVKSRLVMDAALRAREEGKIVPVFIGLCPLPQAFSGIAMFDLSAWGGNADDAVVSAVANQIKRTKQVRSTRSGLEKGMGAARTYEPQGLIPPPVLDGYAHPVPYAQPANSPNGYAHAPYQDHGYPTAPDYTPLPALDESYGETQSGYAQPSYHNGYGAPISVQGHSLTQQGYDGGYPAAAEQSQRPYLGGADYASPSYSPPQVQAPRHGGLESRPQFSHPGLDIPVAQTAPARRFAGLTPADDHQSPAGWADAWVASELRNRGVSQPSFATAAAMGGDANRSAYRDFSGTGAALPSAVSPVSAPAGNSFDAPARPTPAQASDPWQRHDRFGFERPAGAQDPFGAQDATAEKTRRLPKRNDTVFALLLAVGLAVGAAGAMMLGGGERATFASSPAVIEETTMIAEPNAAQANENPARPEAVRVQAVSLSDALGDAEKAKREPAKSNAGADRGVDRRKR